MKTGIISLFLLLAVTGSWATFLHPFMPFGLQSPHQQYFYNPPQRNLAQEQFFYFPQLRSHLPSHYQSFNYIQHERQAYPLYNAPEPPRFPFYPNVRDSYNPVVQYIYQQVPVESVPSNSGYGAHVPEPVLKDCNEIQIEMQQPELVMHEEPAMQAEVAMQQEPVMQAELAMQLEPVMMNKKAEEIMSEEITKEATPTPTNSPTESESMGSTESIQKEQELMEVSTESTETIMSDAIASTETTPEETTTLA